MVLPVERDPVSWIVKIVVPFWDPNVRGYAKRSMLIGYIMCTEIR